MKKKGFPIKKPEYDPSGPVEIAPRIWWVGHLLEGDPFQCHVYLIENGDQSLLLDPGSVLTFRHTLAKIEKIVPFTSIRYFLCHHQDPDITAALPLIDRMVSRKDAVVVSHGRAIALLKHYGLDMPFLCVEKDGNWRLDLGGRVLDFILTPYLHFPGAFCSYDRESKTLFSSDLFGGFTEVPQLFATGEGYFRNIVLFHEPYMPSRDILFHGLTRLEAYDIHRIAPQHGSIVPQELVRYMFRHLKELECGTYLMTQSSTDVQKLSRLNSMLQNFLRSLVLQRSFKGIVGQLLAQIQGMIPVVSLSFVAMNEQKLVLFFDPASRFRGVPVALPRKYSTTLGQVEEVWRATYGSGPALLRRDAGNLLALPLVEPDSRKVFGVAELHLDGPVPDDQEIMKTIAQMALPLGIALEREIMYRSMDLERERFYQKAIRDPLTGLYTRYFMQESVKRFFALHDRGATASLEILVMDLDHFKRINDTYGHLAGDDVLKAVAGVIREESRQGDIRIRFGGEEFAVFVLSNREGEGREVAERIRLRVESLSLSPPLEQERITVSIGVAARRKNETLAEVMQRADNALYLAKKQGRNRICYHSDNEKTC